ncbi:MULTISPECIES: chaplin [Streptomyces]|uniref:chaplin n=1 Tax=Streptomyces TaxID=1883 RepID=UPI001E5BD1BD|nr:MULTISPECIES: chaplin [Streptomyces]UFQ17069.1 chaplin [Streptomyces huasconensis]WCL86669.1 chaplin [Streptomyces sp. JCM 35825]
MLSAAAATSILSLSGTAAFADAEADGKAVGSSGILSGNNVQAPVHVPVNACGNTVNGVGVANPAMGNKCANVSKPAPAKHHSHPSHGDRGEHRSSSGGGATAHGVAAKSSGILSGNNVQAPVHVPVNACGNTAGVVSVANPVMGNKCANVSSRHDDGPPPEAGKPDPKPDPKPKPKPGPRTEPGPKAPSKVVPPRNPEHEPHLPRPDRPERAAAPEGVLAETGTDQALLGAAAAASAGLLVGGAILYRRRGAAAAARN